VRCHHRRCQNLHGFPSGHAHLPPTILRAVFIATPARRTRCGADEIARSVGEPLPCTARFRKKQTG
jgi:hypothetical protein